MDNPKFDYFSILEGNRQNIDPTLKPIVKGIPKKPSWIIEG